MSDFQPTRRLGRGLNALLGGGAPAYEETSSPAQGDMRHVAVNQITRNPFQPRKDFDAESLGELASSIREHGILQPLLVREVDGGFQLIAGERRWQAAQKAGILTVPCRVVDVVDKTACEYALEENLKRKDLNDLEKAQAFRDYLTHFECTMEELAKQLSMSRSAVNNMLRLLELPDPVKNALHAGKISAGHARALLPLDQAAQLELSGRIQAESLSVRKTESIVRELLGRVQPPVAAAQLVAEQQVAEQQVEHAPTQTGSQTPLAGEGVPADVTSADNATTSPVQPTWQPTSDAAEPAAVAPTADATPTEGLTLSLEAARVEADELRTNHILSLEQQLTDLFGVKVQIKLKSKENGFIIIPFDSNTEFERILKTARRAG